MLPLSLSLLLSLSPFSVRMEKMKRNPSRGDRWGGSLLPINHQSAIESACPAVGERSSLLTDLMCVCVCVCVSFMAFYFNWSWRNKFKRATWLLAITVQHNIIKALFRPLACTRTRTRVLVSRGSSAGPVGFGWSPRLILAPMIGIRE